MREHVSPSPWSSNCAQLKHLHTVDHGVTLPKQPQRDLSGTTKVT
jgi:hypothetical protein